jgi:hypothetical protein
MRLEGIRKSKQDNDVDVYQIVLNLDELKLLRALVQSAIKYTPKVLETTATCGRLRNFIRTLDDIIKKKYMG